LSAVCGVAVCQGVLHEKRVKKTRRARNQTVFYLLSSCLDLIPKVKAKADGDACECSASAEQKN